MPLHACTSPLRPLVLVASLLASLACAGALPADEPGAALPERSVATVQATAAATRQIPLAAPAPAAAMSTPVSMPTSLSATSIEPIAQTLPTRSLDMGSATEQLLARQRSAPGLRPRPIEGEQAGRSWQRYLKSFETKIPEKYETGIDTGGGR